MPELPEVETTRAGIEPHLLGQTITAVDIRQPRLRWPVSPELPRLLHNRTIERVDRRGKYILIQLANGTIILHLGMSGSLRITRPALPARKHDHALITLDNGKQLRLHDPRRFGALLWWAGDPANHPLLAKLGPEPLTDDFDGTWLYNASRGRNAAVKPFIMNSHVVVGVGNIYASEALFLAGIHPGRGAGRISRQRYDALASSIRQVLRKAIRYGGSTLRDFVREDGQPGYFKQHLNVYDRAGEACPHCGAPIRKVVLGQRSTFYCPRCQR